MDSASTEFDQYVERCKEGGNMRSQVDKEEKSLRLSLYALGRQGKLGNVNTERPGMFSPIERVKWDAWNEIKGMDQNDARQKFIALAKTIEAKMK